MLKGGNIKKDYYLYRDETDNPNPFWRPVTICRRRKSPDAPGFWVDEQPTTVLQAF
jgi:hypothetical protein